MMSSDSEKSSLPETCIKCSISWITCLPLDTQLLLNGQMWKCISSAIVRASLNVVVCDTTRQYLNFGGPYLSLSLSFSIYYTSNLTQSTFSKQV